MLVPRDREGVLREREGLLAALGALAFAAPVARLVVARLVVARFAGALRALDERLVPALADLAREELDLVRVPVARFARVPVDDLRAPLEGADVELEAADVEPSIDHFPDITRCAASATASAMIDPSLVALETMLLAACDAVSAASSPASRIFFRAAGLALIAAAAAASPAASISLLIAAFASLSMRSLEPAFDDDEVERVAEELEREEPFFGDFAIFYLPPLPRKTLYSRSGSLMKFGGARKRLENVKGTAAFRSDALRHGQRPEMWPFVSD